MRKLHILIPEHTFPSLCHHFVMSHITLIDSLLVAQLRRFTYCRLADFAELSLGLKQV